MITVIGYRGCRRGALGHRTVAEPGILYSFSIFIPCHSHQAHSPPLQFGTILSIINDVQR
jgi:hypothetical protein